MVKIVTGKINSYKTTKMKRYYQKHPLGDGFLAIKHMKDDLVHHYDLYQLSTGQTIPYIIRDSFLKEDQKVRFQIGPYCFLEDAYLLLEDKIKQMMKHQVSPIYLDEIGLLELEGKGLAQILEMLLSEDIDLCLVIRSDLVHKVIDSFHINKYEFINEKMGE